MSGGLKYRHRREQIADASVYTLRRLTAPTGVERLLDAMLAVERRSWGQGRAQPPGTRSSIIIACRYRCSRGRGHCWPVCSIDRHDRLRIACVVTMVGALGAARPRVTRSLNPCHREPMWSMCWSRGHSTSRRESLISSATRRHTSWRGLRRPVSMSTSFSSDEVRRPCAAGVEYVRNRRRETCHGRRQGKRETVRNLDSGMGGALVLGRTMRGPDLLARL